MKQSYKDMIQARVNIINNWEQSEEYRRECAYLKEEYARLYAIGKKYCSANLEDCFRKDVVRTEAASYGGLHRGFYCPSLVEDIVVGNVKRGEIRKRITSRSKNYFLYGFDQDNRLILADMYYNGRKAETEFLFYEDGCIYGITQWPNKETVCITEEKYEQGKLMHYETAYFLQGNCWKISREEYMYDEEGLYSCTTYELTLRTKELYRKDIRIFERKDGYLTRYTSVGAPFDKALKNEETSVYEVRIKRKA